MPRDLDLLQGSWSIVEMEMDGQAAPAAMLSGAGIVVEGDRFTSLGMGDVYTGTLTLNARRKPRQFELHFDAGPEKGATNFGIYQLTADTWKLCLATRGTERPARFESTPGSGIAVETLVRAGAVQTPAVAVEAVEAEASGTATEFEGEWKMVSGTMDGVPMKDSDVQWVRRIVRGNRATVMAGPQTILKVEFTYDAGAGTIDYVVLQGPHKGKAQLGIYRFDGDVVTFCLDAPGTGRPDDFRSVRGDGRTLTAWKKL